ncbi:hypothetical protein CRUP_038088, partial [Coryphaenoides rupestris]
MTSHHHGYKHYPSRPSPYSHSYLSHHTHTSVSLSEGVPGSEFGSGSVHQAPPTTSQYQCLWTVDCGDVSPAPSPYTVLE